MVRSVRILQTNAGVRSSHRTRLQGSGHDSRVAYRLKGYKVKIKVARNIAISRAKAGVLWRGCALRWGQ